MESENVPVREAAFPSAERWEKIKNILDTAIQMPEQDRAEFLHSACSEDSALRKEIQQLITTYERTAISLELSANAALNYAQSEDSSHVLRNGQFVAGRFGVVRFLDRGGMGEVYEAWDSELQDLVALKTIRQEIAAIPMAIDRFKQEVKRARGISHPNVCRVYDLFSHELSANERLWFLTMELLLGQTLSDHLQREGPFRPEQALDLVEQIVAGLAAAHDLGVVHRDFKSSNVMLVSTIGNRTRAVVTDFGLSVALSPEDEGAREVGRGGTPAYMAPEQVNGGKVGLATDQYALGVVICEMLAGQRPKRVSDDQHGNGLQLPEKAMVPKWEALIRRCLQPIPENRFGHIREIAAALGTGRLGTGLHKRAITLVAVIVILLAITAIKLARKPVRLEKLSELTAGTDFSINPSISRDGSMVAYSSDKAQTGNLDIWIQRLPRGTPVRLTTDVAEDKFPSLAPDGSSVVFRSERDGGGIYIANSSGGLERLLAPGGRNPRFSPDGQYIAYWIGDRDDTTPSGKLYVLSLRDGHLQQLATDFSDARWPVWSSDGHSILFSGCQELSQPMPACLDWWVISADASKVENTGALSVLRQRRIEPLEGSGGWYADTVLFTGRSGGSTSLWEIKVSQKSLRAEGPPQQLTSGISRDVDPVLAQNGTLVFGHLSAALHVWRIAHAMTPTSVESTKITQDAGTDSNPSVSRDGHWLVFSRLLGTRRDLWIKNLLTGTETMLDIPGADKTSPVVDDTGKLIAFETRDNDVQAIYVTDRKNPPRKICEDCSRPSGWLAQGRALLYRAGAPSAIKMTEVETGSAQTVLEHVGISLSEADWSPINEYMLFAASTTGDRKQVFAVQFPKDGGKAIGKWVPITEGAGFSERPRWSGDGSAIFYISRRDGFSCIWGQRFDANAGRPVGSPFPVMHYHNLRVSPARIAPRSFDLSVSGDTIYLNVGEETASLWTGILKPPGRLVWLF